MSITVRPFLRLTPFPGGPSEASGKRSGWIELVAPDGRSVVWCSWIAPVPNEVWKLIEDTLPERR
ncbi:MAG: hypothetical protein M3N52_11895 [Actinomycetota bacterium]|nr:hypothetical protein [Actinomycetota bacterium]